MRTFIDTTPHAIVEAHIAVTASTGLCDTFDNGGTDPTQLAVLVGEAGVSLVNVMSAQNAATGLGGEFRCVYHITVHPGETLPDGTVVPSKITDIVVAEKTGAASPNGHTITVTASLEA